MKTIALATFKDEPNLFRDEAPLFPAFEKRGVRALPLIWNSPNVDWALYDAVVIRNTWDYHQRPEVFRAWLAQLESLKVKTINPPDLMRWNMNKHYLQELSGVRMVQTIFCEDDTSTLADLLHKMRWEEAVFKPVISASGENTWLVNIDSAQDYQHRFCKIVRRFGAMLQPFMPQIAAGEWSFVFFDGAYSHTALKVPADGNIFAHEERGAKLQLIEAPARLIEQAASVIDKAIQLTGLVPAYARVDGILDNDNFVLMELECVEPELYFSHCAEAADRFVDVILKRLGI